MDKLFKGKFHIIRLLFLLLIFASSYSGWIISHYMTTPSIPHPIETYHGKNTLIEHEKKIKGQDDTITQQFRFRIETVAGNMYLLIQKDGQRRMKAKKQSEIKALTSDVIKEVLLWMQFTPDAIKGMRKSELVEFMCLVFKIPTTATLNINPIDAAQIVEYLIDLIEDDSYDDIDTHLHDYISGNQTNMKGVGDVILLCQQERVDLCSYLNTVWTINITNFEANRNDDFKYRKAFDSLTESKTIISLQTLLKEDIAMVLETYNQENNKCINHCLFWYSIDVLLFKLFNCSVKQWVISEYMNVPTNRNEQMNEQRKCAIYKYYGSVCNSLKDTYKSKSYGPAKSKVLLSIVDVCLISYNARDFEATLEECKNEEYLKVPLRLRLQNRGFLSLINYSFYNNVAIKMYSNIMIEIERIFRCYDPNKIKQLEKTLIEDELLFDKFDQHIGLIPNIIESDEKCYKQNVWKDMIHRVISRIVLSLNKKNRSHNNHVGAFRTGIKAIQSKQK
eukprot:474601_1